MKRTRTLIVVATLVAGFVASGAMAQRGSGGGRNYDPKTVETLHGKVVSMEKVASPRNPLGIHLMMQTEKEMIPVHLGPAWFIEKQTPQIETGDTITVTGSRIMIDEKPVIIAAEIKKGDKVIKLRDDNGVPTWSGAGRRGQ